MSSIGQGLSMFTVAELRHRLRTPLNHIIGYSEMLREELDGANPDGISAELEKIRAAGNELLACFPETWNDSELELKSLRSKMMGPLNAISRSLGELLQFAPNRMIVDLLRIGTAVGDLMRFVQEQSLPPQQRSPTQFDDAVSARRSTGGAAILVVDDDEPNRDILSRQLQRLGYSAVCVPDGVEALGRLKADHFDLALVDFMMSEMNGLQVLESIKKDRVTHNLPVIMISALDEVSGVTECIERGAEDYIFKPFDPILLRARINAAIERTRLRLSQQERTQELERMSQELKRSNEDLKRFAYMASHDLQAPLRTITAYLQLLERRLADRLSAEDRALIDFPIEGAKRMSQLIKDLLIFSQVSTEDREFKRVSCEQILASTLDDLSATIAECQAVITSDSLPTVIADDLQLRQLFLNLIGNALKYRSDEPPRIHIGARREQAGWQFSVSDNGLGIPTEYLNDIFKLFRRLHGDDRPGTGLGLSICKRIMERLGGQIWVESQAGVGSTFYFNIPDKSLSV